MTILTLQPGTAASKDTYIDAGSTQSWNFGSAVTLRTAGPASSQRILIQFDLSSIAPGTVIHSAILSLVQTAGTGPHTVDVHRALTDWFEGNGSSSVPTIAGSSWTKRDQFNNLAWGASTAGGQSGTDFSATIAATASVNGNGTYTWDITSEVNAMINSGVTNRGWWIIQPSGGPHTFVSSDDSGQSSSWPKLVIDYSVGNSIIGDTAGTSTVIGTLTTVKPSLALQPDETTSLDTYILSNTATFNYGITIYMITATAASGAEHKILIKFDLTSLPPGAIVQSAYLTLWCESEISATDEALTIRRSLVDFFEGASNGANPSAGVNASTWNSKNANGSIAWGVNGGLAGTDYELVANATDIQTVTAANTFVRFDVTADIQKVANGIWVNHGWWIVRNDSVISTAKVFTSSSGSNASHRPTLAVVFQYPLIGSIGGTSTAVGHVVGIAEIQGSADGIATAFGQLITNFFAVGHALGTSAASGTLKATGNLRSNVSGDSAAVAIIRASYHSVGSAAGTSSHVAHIKGKFNFHGVTAGVGTAIARVSSEGQMRAAIFGTSTAIATAIALATHVAAVIGCNPVPLFHITNGSVKPNGQLNILNFLGDRAGYFLVNYKPQIGQYKDNGYWSSSPQSQGRRLRGKVFDNVIDVLEVSARAGSQDALIQYQQDLLDFQEAASDYWASDYAFLPYYLVARAARETNTRYALIHMISCPELENPYTQPFFDDAVGATFVSLTIRIEHSLWTSTPPGRFDCVEVSGQREWTVSGWQVGS